MTPGAFKLLPLDIRTLKGRLVPLSIDLPRHNYLSPRVQTV